MPMLFSVVIPLFNSATYIGQALGSVLAQSCQDFEIIVVNDGSTDTGPAVVMAQTDPRIRMITQPNAGVSAARNRAISMANGEWIAFLDADDLWETPYLDSLRSLIRAHPEVDAVATSYFEAADLPGGRLPPRPDIPEYAPVELITDLPERWTKARTFCTSSFAVRCARLRAMTPCFPLGDSHGEDLDVWFRVAEASHIAFLPLPLAVYRSGAVGSLSKKNAAEVMPPYLLRMRDRALSGQLSAAAAKSALRFVAQFEISQARRLLGDGDRFSAAKRLWSGAGAGWSLRRWWVTAALFFMPAVFASKWDWWRKHRDRAAVDWTGRSDTSAAPCPVGESQAQALAPQKLSLVDPGRCRVSIVIKTLNEEANIANAVESALRAIHHVGGEVVLADSCSTDRTVQIAAQYPIRIVQLADPSERRCGVGPELGYQHAVGEYIYILDGDMQMTSAFLPAALRHLEAFPDAGGVGGLLVETNAESLEYARRMKRGAAHLRAGPVDRLDGGGLYRRTAIESVGYLSDRNLHSYEEFDLAARLRARGWTLHRIAVEAVRHRGHDMPPYALLLRRWNSGYICGLGELVRAAWGRPHLGLVLRSLRELRLYLAVLAWWVVVAAFLFCPVESVFKIAGAMVLLALPVLIQAVRCGSLKTAIFSVVSWAFNALGLLRGLWVGRRATHGRIGSIVLSDCSPSGRRQSAASERSSESPTLRAGPAFP